MIYLQQVNIYKVPKFLKEFVIFFNEMNLDRASNRVERFEKLQIVNFKFKYLVNHETDLLRYTTTGLQSKKLPKHNSLPYLAQWKSKHGFNKSIREIKQTKNLKPHLKH